MCENSVQNIFKHTKHKFVTHNWIAQPPKLSMVKQSQIEDDSLELDGGGGGIEGMINEDIEGQ